MVGKAKDFKQFGGEFIYLSMEFNDNAGMLYCDPNAFIQNWGYGAQPNEQKAGQTISQPSKFFSQSIYPADDLSCPSKFDFPPNCKPNNPPNSKPPQHKQNCNNGWQNCQKPPQKVVFSEPYESVPNFYIDNNFKKGNCDCIPKPKPKCPPPKPPFSFDLKNILPLLSGLFKGGGGSGGIGGILSMLSQNSSDGEPGDEGQIGGVQGGNLNFSSLLKNLSNTGGLNGILNLFRPKNKADDKNFGNKNASNKNTNFGFFKNERNLDNSNKSADFVIKNYSRVE